MSRRARQLSGTRAAAGALVGDVAGRGCPGRRAAQSRGACGPGRGVIRVGCPGSGGRPSNRANPQYDVPLDTSGSTGRRSRPGGRSARRSRRRRASRPARSSCGPSRRSRVEQPRLAGQRGRDHLLELFGLWSDSTRQLTARVLDPDFDLHAGRLHRGAQGLTAFFTLIDALPPIHSGWLPQEVRNSPGTPRSAICGVLISAAFYKCGNYPIPRQASAPISWEAFSRETGEPEASQYRAVIWHRPVRRRRPAAWPPRCGRSVSSAMTLLISRGALELGPGRPARAPRARWSGRTRRPAGTRRSRARRSRSRPPSSPRPAACCRGRLQGRADGVDQVVAVLVEQRQVELELAREVLVEHGLADPGALGDVVHRGGVVALRDEDLLRPRRAAGCGGPAGAGGTERCAVVDARGRRSALRSLVSLPPLVEPAAAELTVDEVRRYSRHLIIPDVGMAGRSG
jgi:hypothetical protein